MDFESGNAGEADGKVKKVVLLVLTCLVFASVFSVTQVYAQTEPSAGQELEWVNSNSLSGNMGQISIDPIMIKSKYVNGSTYVYTVEVISITLYVDGIDKVTKQCNNASIQAQEVTSLSGMSVSADAGSHVVKITVKYWLNSSMLNYVVNGHLYCSLSAMSWTSGETGVQVQSVAQAVFDFLIVGVIISGAAFVVIAALFKEGRNKVRGVFRPRRYRSNCLQPVS